MNEFLDTQVDVPVYSDMECKLMFWTWNPIEGEVPNWFHRKMQTLLLGAKWSKKCPQSVHYSTQCGD